MGTIINPSILIHDQSWRAALRRANTVPAIIPLDSHNEGSSNYPIFSTYRSGRDIVQEWN